MTGDGTTARSTLVLAVSTTMGFMSVSLVLLAAFPAPRFPLFAIQAFAVAMPLLAMQYITRRAYPDRREAGDIVRADGGERR